MKNQENSSPLREERLPSTLSAFLDSGHNVWLQSSPEKGHLSLFSRKGIFVDLEAIAVERKHLFNLLGTDRVRALLFRTGMEQGRRDAARHFNLMNDETALAINSSIVFGQLKGLYEGKLIESTIDLAAKTVCREIVLHQNFEALAHHMFEETSETCVCWCTAGYLSGHLGELTGRRVLTIETECIAQGAEACRFRSQLDHQWGEEADWIRTALAPKSITSELQELETKMAEAEHRAHEAEKELMHFRKRFASPIELADLTTNDEVMKNTIRKAERAAQTDLPVLLTGPRGSGKEAMAHGIHMASSRCHAPFIPFDCLYAQDGHAASELLGFAADTFPDAAEKRLGVFSRAQGGIVYIENIDSLRLDIQGVLARIIKEGNFCPSGCIQSQAVDVRVMASLRQDPAKAILRRELLEDLYDLFKIASIEIPSLCRRGMDTLLLFERFLFELRERYNRPNAAFNEDAKRILLEYAWPGNVAQLKSTLEYALLFSQGDEITPGDLPDEVLAVPSAGMNNRLTPEAVYAALRQSGGNRGEAAGILSVSRTTLWRAMHQMGIS